MPSKGIKNMSRVVRSAHDLGYKQQVSGFMVPLAPFSKIRIIKIR